MTAPNKAEDAFAEALSAIKADRAKGAAALSRDALNALAASAHEAEAETVAALFRILKTRALQLASVRPGMAPLSNLTTRFIEAVEAEIETHDIQELDDFRHFAAHAAHQFVRISQEAGISAARKAAARIGDYRNVATLSDSGTVFQTFMALHQTGKVKALVGEGRPGCEGVALASRLSEAGIPVELMTDAALIGAVASQTGTTIDAVLIGADTLLPDGGAVNKVGSLGLALAAKAAGIPLFIVAESFKRLPKDGRRPALEEMGEADLRYSALDRSVPEGVTLKNPYFEEIPAALIGAIVTEE